MLLEEERKVFELLTDYVSGKISRADFTVMYGGLISKLESKLNEGLYHPLNVIVPTKDNSERAWKENMRSMYLREIESLDKLLEEDEPSYAEKLNQMQQKELCREAIEFIPKAALDRSSKEWIESHLIKNGEFVFIGEHGESNFGSYKVLYQAVLDRKSFIMTALCGALPQLTYDYALLIQTLKKQSGVDTVWMRCSEPDGLTSVESTPWYMEPADEIENLSWLEYTDPQTTQWGVCHLLFMPSNREWVLVHSNDFEKISITLHGPEAFVGGVLNELGNA